MGVSDAPGSARADYEAWQAPRAVPGRRRPVADRAVARCTPAGRRDRHQWRRQLFDVDAPALSLPRLPHAAGALLRRDGLRRSGGHCRQGGCTRAHRRIVERRRLLPHERAGAGHRRPVRAGGDFRRHRQRHVRDDPDAPGAEPTPDACRARTCAIRISPRWREPTVPRAKPSCAPRNSRRPSSGRCRRGRPRAAPRQGSIRRR